MPDRSTPQSAARYCGRRTAAALTAVTLLAAAVAGCTDEPEPATALNTQSIQAAAQGLPTDSVSAAEQLIARIHDADPAGAQGATAELLRRSGFTIVSGSGQVLAVPDRLALREAQVYAELIPALTRSVREDYRYRIGQLAEVLQDLGVTTKRATFQKIADGAAGWGKRPGADPVFQTAGAAVRALSTYRGQVLYGGADPASTDLDPLQNLLLLAHATSGYATVTGKVSGGPRALGVLDRLLGTGVAYADEPGGCAALHDLYGGLSQAERDNLDFYLDETASLLAERAGEKAAKAHDIMGKATTLINGALLVLGSKLELVSDKATTHFKHKAGTRDEHVTLTTTASWDIGIAAAKLECFSLAGLDLPAPGPLEGYRIWWGDRQPGKAGENSVKYLAYAAKESDKALHGSLTDGQGKATLEVKPPVEEPPGTGRELKGSVVFIASLDKEDFPFSASDVYTLAMGGAMGKVYDLVIELLTKAMLPSRSIRIEVTYHGPDIVIARGTGSASFPGFLAIKGLKVDLISCDGATGPYKGIAGYGQIDSGFLLQAQGTVVGKSVPASVGGQESKLEMKLPSIPGTATAAAAKGTDGADFLSVRLNVDTDEQYGSQRHEVVSSTGTIGRPIGEVEMLLGGKPWPFGGLSWSMYRMARDKRCGATEYHYDNA